MEFENECIGYAQRCGIDPVHSVDRFFLTVFFERVS